MIGTGFAGAVTACRLTQAGRKICVLERGRRYEPDDLPVYPAERPSRDPTGAAPEYVQPDLSRCFWNLGQGLWDVRDLGDVVVGQAAGYGGGSLIYANVHLRAPAEVFEHRWPREYRRDLLGPYYDLAAYMLDAKKMPDPLRPPKRAQLKRAAEKLTDDPRNPRVWYFDPPLAVNFPAAGVAASRDDRPRKNRWGREQRTCDLRGDCCFGCTKQAKNTLDLNYLAIAEDAEKRGKPAPDIRTLAEVISIEQLMENGSLVYQVDYLDHLFGGREVPVRGKVVFLCAGAVNTTELLLRCRQAEKLKFPQEELGTKFHPNADTLAAVFDCEEVQETDRGPTITGALLYSRDSDDPDRFQHGGTTARDWFLIEDGGMPTALEPLLGTFRSPVWAGRNRYREGPASRPPGRQFYADLPFENVVDVLSGLTRGAVREGFSRALSIAEQMRAGRRGQGLSREKISDLLPDQLEKALQASRKDLLEASTVAAEPVVERFLVKTAEKLETRYPELDDRIRAAFPIEGLEIGDMQDLHLAQRVLRLAVQFVWGSEGGMVERLVDLLGTLLVPEGSTLVDRAADLLRWALDYRPGDGHTALLLSMGRDSRPGELGLAVDPPSAGSRVAGENGAASLLSAPLVTKGTWGDVDAAGTLLLADIEGGFKVGESLVVDNRIIGTATSEPMELTLIEAGESRAAGVWALRFTMAIQDLPTAPLRAKLPGPLEATERVVQERILRDLAADAWNGELRTNPAWSILGRRVTVHSQGGCPMGTVTRPNGEVIGCDGLYVMDGAALPTPVGVNPSATITAIAEYKIEKYIATLPGREGWRADEFDDALRWAGEGIEADGREPERPRIRRDELDPIGDLERRENISARQSAPPRHEPLGIEFRERMEGFHARSGSDPSEDVERHRQEALDPYRKDERKGIDASAKIVTDLKVEIADLALFLEAHREARENGPAEFPKMRVTGTVTLNFVPELTFTGTVEEGSYLQLLDPTPGQGREERILIYELCFRLRDFRYILLGNKYIRDDPSFDVWQDATTLFFDLLRQRGEDRIPVRRGILRLPVSEFLETQIPSFIVKHTEDPARQSWALAAFGQYFFGNLMDVYVPQLDRVAEVVKGVMGRTHV
ncbi:MAG: GMC oxidoreductase [Myxococcota bacterium]